MNGRAGGRMLPKSLRRRRSPAGGGGKTVDGQHGEPTEKRGNVRLAKGDPNQEILGRH